MAHGQSKSEHGEKTAEAKVSKNVSQSAGNADEGGSWQFKFVLGVIALGLVILILKSLGVF